MGAAGRTRGVPNQIFNEFGMILGHRFETLFGSDGLNENIATNMFPEKMSFKNSRVEFWCFSAALG